MHYGNVAATDIGIITAYKPQVQALQNSMPSFQGVIGTIDAFQGKERKYIIVSLVRSNRCNAPGFWQDGRRLNVALTRAQLGCILR